MAYQKRKKTGSYSKKTVRRYGSSSGRSGYGKSFGKRSYGRRFSSGRRASTQTVKLVIEQVAPQQVSSSFTGVDAKAALKARL